MVLVLMRLGITVNAHGVSANAAGITVNAHGVSANAAGITVNAHGISANVVAINSLGGVTAGVSANAAGITVNADAISANALAISNIAQSEWTTTEPTGITASTIYYNGSIQVGASGASGVTTNAEIQIMAPGNATLNIIADTHDDTNEALFHPSIMMTQDVGSTLNTIASTIGIPLPVLKAEPSIK